MYVPVTSVTSTSTIGLIQDFDQLNAFVAAAGFTQAAAFRNLSDPPFINTGSSSGGWSVAQFILPSDYGLNGTLTLNTTAIQTVANCANPTQTNLNQETFVLTSTSVDGCVVSVEYDPTDIYSCLRKPDLFPFRYLQNRAVAIRSGVPAAIFQQASQQPGGLQTTFNLPNGFLDITQDVYTQYLSIVAGFVYFVGTNTPLTAQVTSLTPILWIDPLPGHTLAILLILVGFAGFIIQILHQRERRQVLLTCPPGSIAAVLSKTALSGFGELLLPYDDEVTLERKLSGLRFRLDRRTGAIVVDDDTHIPGLDDAMISLLRSSHNLRNSATSESSSMTVHQADSGYSSLRTPYDP
ncbi:hypothetical protein H0H92_004451 [Tricholoma furcatifolium]|nr:hypothetical protein H0H92_004451 [Tricholoma furcatifolium]